MRKGYLLLLFLFFLPSIVLAQATTSAQVTNPDAQTNTATSNFEKIVVKEHFVTKKEIKDYLDVKAVEYQKTTDQQLYSAFKETERIIDAKINKFIIKLILLIVTSTFFAGSLWYFVKKRLDMRYSKIQQLKTEEIIPVDTPIPMAHVESVSEKPELAEKGFKPTTSIDDLKALLRN